jgi:H/ACA ribonucleoprotein complex non-core subunit NAF1
MTDLENDLVISEIIESLKEKIEINSNERIKNEKYINEQINDKFMKMLDDDSSSDCSSSSTLTSSSDSDSDKKTGDKNSEKYQKSKKLTKKVNIKQSDDDEDDEDDEHSKKQLLNQKYLKTKDEITLDDLGPIEKLNLKCEDDVKLVKMGRVTSIVDDKLVIIQSLTANKDENDRRNQQYQPPPLDEETILFDSNRNAIGKIFEIFGPVASPFYSIRFNTTKEIKENNLELEINSFVFYAPESQKYTKYIFNVDELRQMKGSDASWNNDNEPPVECLDYSDDEKEKNAKKLLKMSKKKNGNLAESSTEEGEEDDTASIASSSSSRNFNNNNKNFATKRTFNNQFKKSSSSYDGFNNNRNNNNNNNPRLPKSQSNYTNQFKIQQQQQQPPIPQQQVSFQNFYPNPYMNWQNGMMPPQFNPSMMQIAPPNFPPQYPPQYMHPMFHQYPYYNNQQQPPFMNYNNQPAQQNQSQTPQTQSKPNTAANNSIIDKRFIKNENLVKKSF